MKHYEMLCVLPGTLAEAEVTPAVEQVSQTLGSYDAENVTVEDMGKSKFAYPVKHIRYGYFQLFRFELDADKLAKLENSVRLLGTLLRVIIRVSDPSKATQYTLAQDPTALSAPPKEDPRDSRDSRGRRPDHRTERPTEKSEEESVKSEDIPTKEVVAEEKTEEPKVEEAPVEKAEEVKEAPVEKKIEEPKKVEKKEKKISIEDIDQKLDEL